MDPTVLAACNPEGRWRDLNAIGMVRAERTVGAKTSLEERFFIMSLDGTARTFGEAVRIHWEIENVVHWTLDVVFRQDTARVLIGHGPKPRCHAPSRAQSAQKGTVEAEYSG
ncbi:ISAs1 family transposase [Candidatus Gracilibacteria bacterium]|nr:ISAs1 family transposase [Candidatus Gracilibacteria bacterium]